MQTAESVRHSAARRPLPTDTATAFSPVVVCGVEDALAERALVRFAAELVERIGGRLVLVHAQPALLALEPQIAYAARGHDSGDRLRVVARRLARLAARDGAASTTRLHVAFGDLEQRLLTRARTEDAALILISDLAAGRSNRPGGLAQRVIAHATCPVVVVPDSDTPHARPVAVEWGEQPIAAATVAGDATAVTASDRNDVTHGSIICGVDGSRDARMALKLAAQLSTQLDARLVVAHVVQPPAITPGLGPTARQLSDVPVDALLAAGAALVDHVLEEEHLDGVERRVVLGFPADRLADIADEEAAKLIVVGSRGRGAFKAAFLGSVSTNVIGVARCPVLVVPPSATRTNTNEAVQSPPAVTVHAAPSR